MNTPIPHINLLALHGRYITAWEDALKHFGMQDQIPYTPHEASLSQLESNVKFDLVVSPANSYAILDGGFDDAISRAFSLKNDCSALTRHCQAILYDRYRGFQPPGSCMLMKIPPNFLAKGATKNVWGAEYIAHCPTMRTPSDCTWDHEVVYECIWCLMCEIDRHNRTVSTQGDGRLIQSILMTPLATGTGGVSAEKWAHQAVLAIKHYLDASRRPREWSTMNWPEAGGLASQVEETHGQ